LGYKAIRHPEMTPMSPNRVDEHLDGIGAAGVDEVDPREVENNRLFTSKQVGHTVDGPSRCSGKDPGE
jgi:hypothetical protein